MQFKLTLAALIIAPIMFTACAKKEDATNAEQQASVNSASLETTPEQQAAIDAIDKPVLDEKNTDVVETATSEEVAASEVQ